MPDWLEEFVNFLSEKYDINTSEAIRLEMCMGIICTVNHLNPDSKLGITPEDIQEEIIKDMKSVTDRDKFLKLLSKIYFEARKGVEIRMKLKDNVGAHTAGT